VPDPDRENRIVAPLGMIALFGYLAADLVVRALPEPMTNGLARLLGRFVFALGVPARRRLESNLARLHPGAPARVREQACRSFERFALSVADFLRLGHMRPEHIAGRVVVRGREHLEAARASGRGVIVLSAHVGNWEWGAAYLAADGTPLHIAAQPHGSRAVERFFRSRRASWGVQHLDGRPAWLAAARALRGGGWIALMGDRPARDLGGSLCAWATALSRRTGAMILPAAMMQTDDGRHVLWCDAPLTPQACLEGEYRAAMHRHLQRAAGQWFAFEPLSDALA
jgi:KDO2-lipid IV(A) lauroyltransferase